MSCGCYNNDKRRKPSGHAAFNRLYNSYKSTSERRGYKFSLTKEEFKALTVQNCYYCGIVPQAVMTTKQRDTGKIMDKYIYNGVDRVENNIGYLSENCVPCCKICNVAKASMSKREFLS